MAPLPTAGLQGTRPPAAPRPFLSQLAVPHSPPCAVPLPPSPMHPSPDSRLAQHSLEASSSEGKGGRGGHGPGASCCFVFHSCPTAHVVMERVHVPAWSRSGPRGGQMPSWRGAWSGAPGPKAAVAGAMVLRAGRSPGQGSSESRVCPAGLWKGKLTACCLGLCPRRQRSCRSCPGTSSLS